MPQKPALRFSARRIDHCTNRGGADAIPPLASVRNHS